MRTPEQFLREVITDFPDNYIVSTSGRNISIHWIIGAMEKYAVQSVECAKDSIDNITEQKIHELCDKFDALDDEYQDLVRIVTHVYKNAKDVLMDGLSPDDYEKLKNHIGV